MPNINALSVSSEAPLSKRDKLLLECATCWAYRASGYNSLDPSSEGFSIKMLYSFVKAVDVDKDTDVSRFKAIYCGYLTHLGKDEIAKSLEQAENHVLEGLREVVMDEVSIIQYSTLYNIIVSTNESAVDSIINCTSMVMSNSNSLTTSSETSLSDRDKILLQCATGIAYFWRKDNCLDPVLEDFGIKMLYAFAKAVDVNRDLSIPPYKSTYCGYLRHLGKDEIAKSLVKVPNHVLEDLREIVKNEDKIKEYSTLYNIIVNTNKSTMDSAIKCALCSAYLARTPPHNYLSPWYEGFAIKMLYGFAKAVEMNVITSDVDYKSLYCGYLRHLGKNDIAGNLEKMQIEVFDGLKEVVEKEDRIKQFSALYDIIVNTNKSTVDSTVNSMISKSSSTSKSS
ncbi:unnamed protein product [Bursaphelenchus okinawaensis]|uniref:Uncharacterized protein n=1 Tax=Bursaphelenchus okinawaensis TaxID=465554 RepID=A0A811L400_9BILA|nr:unnamed protein product [Bursaphelenchus okinawaensis]CAG9116883.1 unnamed protein product [Bursaphelenchus okinawaensis]